MDMPLIFLFLNYDHNNYYILTTEFFLARPVVEASLRDDLIIIGIATL